VVDEYQYSDFAARLAELRKKKRSFANSEPGRQQR
jgi:hypothetical protein